MWLFGGVVMWPFVACFTCFLFVVHCGAFNTLKIIDYTHPNLLLFVSDHSYNNFIPRKSSITETIELLKPEIDSIRNLSDF